MIRYSTQCIDDDDIQAVVKALRSDYLTQGPLVEQFEQEVSKYVGNKFAAAVNSATSALHLACLVLDVGKNSIVWTSPNSFSASANCVLYCGAKVDFVDIDPITYNISPQALEKKLTEAEKTKSLPNVLIVVHFAGQSCDMKKIHDLSKKYGFKIIEDASHALGAEYNGKKVGSCEFSNVSIFSFHPVKMITTGEGGMTTTNDPNIHARIVSLRSHGLVRETDRLLNPSDGGWYYEQQQLGYNYRMTEIQSALGLSQLKKLNDFVEKRREIAKTYNERLKDLPLQLPQEIPTSNMSFHLYVVRIRKNPKNKANIFKALLEKGIGVQVHYIPIYRHPFYRDMGFRPEHFPNMEQYYEETLSIPNHPKLTKQDQDKVIQALYEVLA